MSRMALESGTPKTWLFGPSDRLIPWDLFLGRDLSSCGMTGGSKFPPIKY